MLLIINNFPFGGYDKNTISSKSQEVLAKIYLMTDFDYGPAYKQLYRTQTNMWFFVIKKFQNFYTRGTFKHIIIQAEETQLNHIGSHIL